MTGTLSADDAGTPKNITIAGNWTNSGMFTSGSGMVTFNATTGITQNLTSGGSSFNNLTHNVAGTVQLQDALVLTGTLDNSAGTLNANSKDITVGGNWTNSTTATFTSGTNTVLLNGTGTQNLTTGGDVFNNLTSSEAGRVELQDALTVSGNFTNSSGNTFDANDKNITVGGHWTNTATFTFTAGTQTVTFSAGTGAQDLTTGGSASSFNCPGSAQSGETASSS